MAREIETDFVTDRAGMAQIFGCSINHINKLVTRGLPRRSRGQYSIPECVQWAIADATTRSGIDPDELPAVVEARTRLYVAQERHKRLETRRLEGELIEHDEVRSSLLSLAHVLVGSLEGLPVRLAQDFANARTTAEAAAILREHCVAARQELAKRVAALGAPMESDGEVNRAAADQERGGVGGRRARRAAGESAPGPVVN